MKYFVPGFRCAMLFSKDSFFSIIQPSEGARTITSNTKQYKKLLPSKAFGTIKWNNKNPFKPNNNKWHRNYRILDFALPAIKQCRPLIPPSALVQPEPKPQTFSSEGISRKLWHFNYIERYFCQAILLFLPCHLEQQTALPFYQLADRF